MPDRGDPRGRSTIVTPGTVRRLSDEQLSAVLGLAVAATRADGVAPLSEQVLLDARDREPVAGAGSTAASGHFLVYAGTVLAGYGHLEPGEPGEAVTAEVVVAPSCRRRGFGTGLDRALGRAVARQAPQVDTLQLWSHGDLDSARAFALRGGYSRRRELWQMRRALRAGAPSLPAVSLPEGFQARHFVVGEDEEAWLEVNARAFVGHPEQGRMTRGDLDRRTAEPWFDARGFLLIEDRRGPARVLAASHWTKVVPEGPQGHPTQGEVYVVGVDPAYQGLGLGHTITVLGLAYLRDRGLDGAMLYVDADNRAAVATYSRLDFARSAVDIMYSRIVHIPV